jgi:hypothetical protein
MALFKRVRDAESKLAAHDEQLGDHDRLLHALETHLRDLVGAFAGFQRIVIACAVAILVTSPLTTHFISLLGVA